MAQEGRELVEIRDGTVLIGSDAHYWPGLTTTAHRAFVHLIKTLKPKMVIMNGDVLDGATISRHPRIAWGKTPTLAQELAACQLRLGEIERAAPKGCLLKWVRGNHDNRFETKLSNAVPEFEKVPGTSLSDHFRRWTMCWGVWINERVVVKHRWKGGVHAVFNNMKGSGVSIFTGHLHSLKVAPYTDYSGTRWGVDCGMLADQGGPQFLDYSEDNPQDWRSGFVVATFKGGKLMWPEVVPVVPPCKVFFRGEILNV